MNGGTEITEINHSMITHLLHLNEKMKSDLEHVNSKVNLMEKKVSSSFRNK